MRVLRYYIAVQSAPSNMGDEWSTPRIVGSSTSLEEAIKLAKERAKDPFSKVTIQVEGWR